MCVQHALCPGAVCDHYVPTVLLLCYHCVVTMLPLVVLHLDSVL